MFSPKLESSGIFLHVGSVVPLVSGVRNFASGSRFGMTVHNFTALAIGKLRKVDPKKEKTNCKFNVCLFDKKSRKYF